MGVQSLIDGEGFLQQLQQQVAGLVWLSETDAPFTIIHWPLYLDSFTIAELLHQANLAPETPVQVLALADFFAPATQAQPWHSEAEMQTVAAFQALETFLKENLSDISVYRCGIIEQNIYILGQWTDGSWVGLMTQAVET